MTQHLGARKEPYGTAGNARDLTKAISTFDFDIV